MKETLLRAARYAITALDLQLLSACLDDEQSFEKNSPFPLSLIQAASVAADAGDDGIRSASQPQSPPCCLLEHAVRAEFPEATQMLLEAQGRLRPTVADVHSAFLFAMKHDLDGIVRIFLEMCLEHWDHPLTSGDCAFEGVYVDGNGKQSGNADGNDSGNFSDVDSITDERYNKGVDVQNGRSGELGQLDIATAEGNTGERRMNTDDGHSNAIVFVNRAGLDCKPNACVAVDNVAGGPLTQCIEEVGRGKCVPERRCLAYHAPSNLSSISLVDVMQHAISKKLNDVAARAILAEKMDVNAEDPWSGQHPLMVVVYAQQAQLTDLMLRRGAVVDAPDHCGTTALMISGSVSSVDCMRILLQHGADANHRAQHSSFGSSLRAAYNTRTRSPNFEALVELLVSAGLNMSHERKLLLSMKSDTRQPSCSSCYARMMNLASQPLSLKMTCFLRIRRCLSDVAHGLSIVNAVRQLQLPSTLVNFLILEYLGNDLQGTPFCYP